MGEGKVQFKNVKYIDLPTEAKTTAHDKTLFFPIFVI